MDPEQVRHLSWPGPIISSILTIYFFTNKYNMILKNITCNPFKHKNDYIILIVAISSDNPLNDKGLIHIFHVCMSQSQPFNIM